MLVQPQRIGVLPRDPPKVHWLDIRHELLRVRMGGQYRAPLDPAATCLFDVASGTGRWAQEMVCAFPGAQVVGLDLEASPKDGEPTPPPNAGFVPHDRFTNLPFPDQSFVWCISGFWPGVARVEGVSPGVLLVSQDANQGLHWRTLCRPLTADRQRERERPVC